MSMHHIHQVEMNSEAETFLRILADGERCTFQTFDETNAKRNSLNRVKHGFLGDHLDELWQLNQQKAGVFVMVNKGDLKGRRSTNVVRVRSVFVDLDGAPIEPILQAQLQPHMIIESSPDRYHAYWLVEDVALNDFRDIQTMLAIKFNGDQLVKDLPRVMRLPGFLHQKSKPCFSRIIKTINQNKFKKSDFIEALNLPPIISDWKSNKNIYEGQRNSTLFNMARGFASKGFDEDSIRSRLTKINDQQCKPPLSKSEVESIATQSKKYSSTGDVSISYRITDSSEYMSLTPMAKALDVAIRRMSKGDINSSISLLPKDLSQWGFGHPKTLMKYREELIKHGFLLQVRPPRYGQNGQTRECGLYRLTKP